MANPSSPSIHLIRVTTDDREHQLWAAAVASPENALSAVLDAIPEGWTAASLTNRLKPVEIEALNLKPGEVREVTSSRHPKPD